MNRIIILSSILLLLLLGEIFSSNMNCYAQTTSSPVLPPLVRTLPSIKDLRGGKSFISIDRSYSIALPEVAYSGNWFLQEGRVVIKVVNPDNVGDKKNLKEFTKFNNTELLSTLSGRITSEQFLESDDSSSSISDFVFDDGKLGIRKYSLFDDGLFILFAQFTNADFYEVFHNALSSFRRVGPDEVNAEIQRKLFDATPESLPQKPKPGDWHSDATDEGLIGKVAKIVEESENYVNGEEKSQRKLSATREFDEAGNLLKTVGFDYRGNPYVVEVYGFIDKKRVSKPGYVRYDYDPPSPMPKPTPSRIQPEPKRDLRYSTSYEKKYQEGKLFETTYYGNNGIMWLRKISRYSKNQIELLIYSTGERLDRKSVSVIDKNGLTIEEVSYDIKTDKSYDDRKYTFTYEFDNKGNWIKKIASNEVTENGKTFFKTTYIRFRTISYRE